MVTTFRNVSVPLAGLLIAMAAGCAHQSPAAPAAPAAPSPAAADPAPGARPEEKNRQLEAEWKDVTLRADVAGGQAVSALKLTGLKLKLFHAAPPPDQDAQKGKEKDHHEDKAAAAAERARPIDLASLLRKITPLDVDHIDILDGEVAFVDTSRKERPELWLHDLQLSVENLTTRVSLTEGRPALLIASGNLAKTGSVSLFITANPFEEGLTFSGRAALVGLSTAELYRFIEPATGLQAPEGTIDVFVEFDCRNGELTGGVKPILKNVKIRPGDGKLMSALKAWVVDIALDLFSDRVSQRNAVATVIPIKGTLKGPDVQLWPTIFGVLRNAIVEGVTSGFTQLPPETAPKKESVVKQGVESLTGSSPPKAQPTPAPGPGSAPPPTSGKDGAKP